VNLENHLFLTPLDENISISAQGEVTYNYDESLKIPADPEGLLTKEDLGICGPLLRTYGNPMCPIWQSAHQKSP